jgi:hypothetical protein
MFAKNSLRRGARSNFLVHRGCKEDGESPQVDIVRQRVVRRRAYAHAMRIGRIVRTRSLSESRRQNPSYDPSYDPRCSLVALGRFVGAPCVGEDFGTWLLHQWKIRRS